MEIRIFDVEHGFCAYLVADNGNTMLFDCGTNGTTGFNPADYFRARGCTGIERFFSLNYDEDHLDGLPRLYALRDRIPIAILNRNTSITPDQIRALKRQQGGAVGPGLETLLTMMTIYTGAVASPPEYPQLTYEVFQNRYPEGDGTNNLSLAVFIHYPGVSILFPGDLEQQGWQVLLRDRAFQEQLRTVNIFVASHHGRQSGYVPEVFNFCKPDIVIISDKPMEHDTQEHSYAQHARGITWNKTDVRRVLTTRKDGTLTITPQAGGYHVTANR